MRILIIEDEPTHLKLAHVVLETAGCTVTQVTSAERALEAIERDPPEIILLDLKLPGMNGLDLARRLKQDPKTHAIPIVAVTAYGEHFRQSDALQAGCNAYLQKPLDTRTLAASMAAILQREEG